MKLQTTSRELGRQSQRALGRNAAARQSLAAFIATNEIANWQRPENLIRIAKLASSRVLRRYYRHPTREEILDMSQAALMEYLEMPDRIRPARFIDVYKVFWKSALREWRRNSRFIVQHSGLEEWFGSLRIDRDDEYREERNPIFSVPADQLEALEVRQLFNLVKKLPAAEQRMFLLMADGANLVECAEELKLRLYPAMAAQDRLKKLVREYQSGDQEVGAFGAALIKAGG
jgi:hypothetical protein